MHALPRHQCIVFFTSALRFRRYADLCAGSRLERAGCQPGMELTPQTRTCSNLSSTRSYAIDFVAILNKRREGKRQAAGHGDTAVVSVYPHCIRGHPASRREAGHTAECLLPPPSLCSVGQILRHQSHLAVRAFASFRSYFPILHLPLKTFLKDSKPFSISVCSSLGIKHRQLHVKTPQTCGAAAVKKSEV